MPRTFKSWQLASICWSSLELSPSSICLTDWFPIHLTLSKMNLYTKIGATKMTNHFLMNCIKMGGVALNYKKAPSKTQSESKNIMEFKYIKTSTWAFEVEVTQMTTPCIRNFLALRSNKTRCVVWGSGLKT